MPSRRYTPPLCVTSTETMLQVGLQLPTEDTERLRMRGRRPPRDCEEHNESDARAPSHRRAPADRLARACSIAASLAVSAAFSAFNWSIWRVRLSRALTLPARHRLRPSCRSGVGLHPARTPARKSWLSAPCGGSTRPEPCNSTHGTGIRRDLCRMSSPETSRKSCLVFTSDTPSH